MSNRVLLTEYFPFQGEPQRLSEGRELTITRAKNGNIELTGIIQRADTLNQNGRIYPRSILEREVRNYQKFVRERRATGQLDHPETTVVELQRASHVITKVWWDGNAVIGTVELLNTSMGKEAQALVNDQVLLGISSRGMGSTIDRGDHQVVGEDFTLLCWDLVAEPSTPKAFLYGDTTSYKDNMVESKLPGFGRIIQASESDLLSEILALKKK
jgi:hypothetical protein